MSRGELPGAAASELPWLTVAQMREVDRIMVDELGIALIQMMENAGRSLAVVARMLLAVPASAATIVVLAGRGGNGGGGMVAARHLSVAGADVRVHATDNAEDLDGVPGHQARALEAMGVPLTARTSPELGDTDLVIDAVLGYSQRGAPRGAARELIETAVGTTVLSLDVPSGVELSTGTTHAGAVRATATVTLAAPKEGLRAPGAGAHVGELLLADISVPAQVYARVGAAMAPRFAEGPLLRVCAD